MPDPLARARSLLEAGRDAEAEVLLQSPTEGLPEAERLALLGFLEARRGNLEAYRTLALLAVRRAQTPTTLYHLGLALSPREGLLILEEALHRTPTPRERGRLALALARTLGRLREALAYAALARLEDAGPYALLEWAWLALLSEETPSRSSSTWWSPWPRGKGPPFTPGFSWPTSASSRASRSWPGLIFSRL